ncbi:uncharacterized protein BX663DRAFT_432060, partial [Cokeromyces recurvatus]|uniref:uncharacterized protein n=1 Tax=Cokeromyces recurvatus TaxID=90255 RepID=UPI0022202B4B
IFTKTYIIEYLNIHCSLQSSPNIPDPISFLLNILLTHPPTSAKHRDRYSQWSIRMPIAQLLLYEMNCL